MTPTRALPLLGLAAALAWGCGDRSVPARLSVGEPFPELRLAILDPARRAGDPAPVPAAGSDVVLNVWATWCEPCRREMASLERLARVGPGVRVIGVSIDDDANLAREFLLKQGVSFANFSDPGGRAVLDALGVSSLPQTFVIRRDGRLAARITGPRDWAGEESLALLAKHLDAKARP